MQYFRRAIVALVALSVSALGHASVLTGSISTSDHVAGDSTGSFFVDYFNVGVTSNTTLTVTYAADSPLMPWLLVVDNTGQSAPLLPAANWESPENLYATPGPGVPVLYSAGSSLAGSTLSTSFDAIAGILYQIGLTSSTYFTSTVPSVPADPASSVGGYTLTVASDARDANTTVLLQQIADPGSASGGTTTTVPAPTPLALLGLGFLALAGLRRRTS